MKTIKNLFFLLSFCIFLFSGTTNQDPYIKKYFKAIDKKNYKLAIRIMKRAAFRFRGKYQYYGRIGEAYGKYYNITKKRGHVSLAIKYLRKSLKMAKNRRIPYDDYLWIAKNLSVNVYKLGEYLIFRRRPHLAVGTVRRYLNLPDLSSFGIMYMTLSNALGMLNKFEKQFNSAENGYSLRPREMSDEIKKYFEKSYKTAVVNIVFKEYIKNKKYQKAVKVLKQAIKEFPKAPCYYSFLSQVYYKNKNYENSLEYAEKSIELIQNDILKNKKEKYLSILRKNIKYFASKIDENNHVKISKYYQKYIKKYNDDYVLLNQLGNYYFKIGKTELAKKYYSLSRKSYEKIFPLKKALIKLTLPFLPGKKYFCLETNNSGENHFGINKYAWDFAIVNKRLKITNKRNPRYNSDFLSWNDKVIAPCSGRIIRVINNITDNVYPKIGINSNEIIIQHKSGYRVILKHFKKNSIKVKVGSYVKRGDFLGLVGNSGNSKVPHLHVMATDKRNVSMPCAFYLIEEYLSVNRNRSYFVARNKIVPKQGKIYRNNVHFRRLR